MIWKAIPGTKGEYQVSNTGLVMTTKTGRILRPVIDVRGYERVALYKTDKDRRYKVHRLVATAFIPNPNSLPQVNHKDGDKRNNNVDNLEWISNADNMKHANANGLRDGHRKFCMEKKKPIIATNIKTGETIKFDSILSAKNALKTCHINEVLDGKRKQAKGYTFKLLEEVGPDADNSH